jgi:DNA modification methylase
MCRESMQTKAMAPSHQRLGLPRHQRDRRQALRGTGNASTVKPVALIADAIRDCSRRGEIVLDGFGGTGSTLIAAVHTRRCFKRCSATGGSA